MNIFAATELVFDYVVAAFAPPALFYILQSERSQRLSYRHLTKTKSKIESRVFKGDTNLGFG